MTYIFTLDKKYNEEVLRFEDDGDELYNVISSEKLIYIEKLNSNIYLPYMNVYQTSIINESLTFYTSRIVNDGKNKCLCRLFYCEFL